MHIKAAWNVLRNGPITVTVEKIVEKEVAVEVVKEAIGQASAVQLFGFKRKTGEKVVNKHLKDLYEFEPYGGYRRLKSKDYLEDAYEFVYAFSCEQAHEEANGEQVTATPCIKVGQQYFRCAHVQPVKTLPKPKVAKGRK